MKATVLQSFVDKETKVLRVSGSVVECSDERFKELSGKGYLKALEDATVKADTKKAVVGA
jgi:hypothetical protein